MSMNQPNESSPAVDKFVLWKRIGRYTALAAAVSLLIWATLNILGRRVPDFLADATVVFALCAAVTSLLIQGNIVRLAVSKTDRLYGMRMFASGLGLLAVVIFVYPLRSPEYIVYQMALGILLGIAMMVMMSKVTRLEQALKAEASRDQEPGSTSTASEPNSQVQE